jgi:hypothetical protein
METMTATAPGRSWLPAGRYTEVADVSGDESWTATTPYAVTVTPTDLLS